MVAKPFFLLVLFPVASWTKNVQSAILPATANAVLIVGCAFPWVALLSPRLSKALLGKAGEGGRASLSRRSFSEGGRASSKTASSQMAACPRRRGSVKDVPSPPRDDQLHLICI